MRGDLADTGPRGQPIGQKIQFLFGFFEAVPLCDVSRMPSAPAVGPNLREVRRPAEQTQRHNGRPPHS